MIDAVSLTLVKVLADGLGVLSPAPAVEVHDLLTAPSSASPRVTVFLFEVGEDTSARNRPPARTPSGNGFLVSKPPMALLLRYMLTAWSGGPQTDQQILSRVVQELYSRPILSGPSLQGALAGTDEALKVSLVPISLEERTRIWHAVQRPYRLSVTYDVRVVNLAADGEREVPAVRQRTMKFALPGALQ